MVIDAGPWEPCRQVGGPSRHVCVLHDVNIGTHMLRGGVAHLPQSLEGLFRNTVFHVK